MGVAMGGSCGDPPPSRVAPLGMRGTTLEPSARDRAE